MPTKTRILHVGEATFLSTGYAVYAAEVLKRLHNSGKYEIAELSCYSSPNDIRNKDIPWKVYPVLPFQDDEKEMQVFQSNPTHQFGKLKFDDAVLDFKPHVVCDLRDPWMCEFEFNSPLREHYKLAWMPTVDSLPSHDDWFELYNDTDAIMAYCEWGLEGLRKQSNNRLNLYGVASPSVDFNIFKPAQNKRGHKQAIGLSENLFIVGTVMRNQKRKLFPDLMDGFKRYLDKCKESNPDLYNRSYLYLHTTYPDIGWDIPSLIKKYGLASKVICTYRCLKCGAAYPTFYQDARTTCRKCGTLGSAGFPTTQQGVDRQCLAGIINLFDVSVQYSCAEGFGIPMVECGACAVPIMAVDYASMSDVVRKLNGYPIKVQRMYMEAETEAERAYPDNQDLADKLYSFANLPEPIRLKKGYEALQGVHKHFTWDKTLRVWESYFDSIDTTELDKKWLSAPKLFQPQTQIPQGLSHESFLQWAFTNILGEPSKMNTYLFLKMNKWLSYGCRLEGRGGAVLNDACYLAGQPRFAEYSQQKAAEELLEIRGKKNYYEQLRCGLTTRPTPRFIHYANNRSKF